MDFVSSLLPFDQIDELFQFSSIPCQQHTIEQDTDLLLPSLLHNSDVTSKPDYSLQRKSSVAFDDNPGDYKRKKIIHRDVERQRRQEMAALYRLLRSLLPLDYLKGKRSVADHMNEAVNYIRHLQKRIEELSEKREELKTSSLNKSSINRRFKCLSSCLQENVTVVENSRGGVQVVISTALTGGVSVSRVLDVLIREGLIVVSCMSTNMNERSLHNIETEVNEGRSINPSELQKKLRTLASGLIFA